MRHAIAAALFATLATSPLHALPGLSPVWELLYNGNEPFSAGNPDHDPLADPDHDGWNNLKESIAGTDPFSATPGDGFLRPTCIVHPWLAETFLLEWQSRIGKSYQLSHSPDLVTWTTDPTPFPGTGDPIALPVSPLLSDDTVPEKLFWRVMVSDPPAPGGTYTPYDLHLLSTRPDIATAIQSTTTGTGGGGEPVDPNSDHSGPTDSHDAAPQDNKIDWQKTPEAKYLWIAAESAGGFVAVDANDRGQILFRRTGAVTDYEVEPVGRIWDPARPAGERLVDVFFQPSKFDISLWKARPPENPGEVDYPDEDDPVTVEGAPFPPEPDNPLLNISIAVQVKHLGPDGSVLADVAYGFTESSGHIEQPARVGGGHFVFLWKADQYGSCKILGESPGYQGNILTVSENRAAGFYREPTGSPPVIRAVMTDQHIRTNNLNLRSDLTLRGHDVTEAAPANTLSGETNRSMSVHPNPRMTPSGLALLASSYYPIEKSIVCGTGSARYLPDKTIVDTISDIPAQPGGVRCGIGRANGAFQLFSDGTLTPTSAHGVLQFDRYGTGIAHGYNGLQIWRNARWFTLAEATGLPGNTFTGLNPKKITENGIIWAGNENGTSNGVLVPVMVLKPELTEAEYETDLLEGADELKIAKMERSLDASHNLQIDNDPHRFYIRLPAALGAENASVKISTIGNPDSAYDDDETAVTLYQSGEILETKSQLLVSDDVDDDYSGGGVGTDDANDDRTHKVQLGGRVNISSVKLGDSTYPLGLNIPVRSKKKIEGKIILVGSTITDGAEIAEYRKIAKERYAQAGIDFNLTITSMNIPDGLDENRIRFETEGFSHGGHVTFKVHEDIKKLVDGSIAENKRGIVTVFVVNDIFGDGAKGFALRKGRVPDEEMRYANVAVISAEKTIRSATYSFTLAHEVGHILTDAGHYGIPELSEATVDYYGAGSETQIEHNLMRTSTSSGNTIGGSKRIYIDQTHMFLNELLTNP